MDLFAFATTFFLSWFTPGMQTTLGAASAHASVHGLAQGVGTAVVTPFAERFASNVGPLAWGAAKMCIIPAIMIKTDKGRDFAAARAHRQHFFASRNYNHELSKVKDYADAEKKLKDIKKLAKNHEHTCFASVAHEVKDTHLEDMPTFTHYKCVVGSYIPSWLGGYVDVYHEHATHGKSEQSQEDKQEHKSIGTLRHYFWGECGVSIQTPEFDYLRREKCTVNGDVVDEWMENLRVKENARHTEETKELLKKGKESAQLTEHRLTSDKYNAHAHDNYISWSFTFLWFAWVLATASCATSERCFLWMCIAVTLCYATLWTDWVRSCTVPTWACYLVVGGVRVYRASVTDEPNDIESGRHVRRRSTRGKQSKAASMETQQEEFDDDAVEALCKQIEADEEKKAKAGKAPTKKHSKRSTKS